MERRKRSLSASTDSPLRRSKRRGANATAIEEVEKSDKENVAELLERIEPVPEEEEVKAEESNEKVKTVQENKSEEQSGANLGQEKITQSQDEPETLIKSVIPRGKPKSGRVWKNTNKKRFSEMVMDRPLRTSWDAKMKQRQEKKLVKAFSQQLKDEKQNERDEKKRRREENLQRRLENERKAEVVQVIRNPAKLKRAKKKQLRHFAKRDTLKLSQSGKKQSPNESVPSRKQTVKKEGASSS
ncbi:coiled-coil domain-containing protein 86 [Discoglossus pictus]